MPSGTCHGCGSIALELGECRAHVPGGDAEQARVGALAVGSPPLAGPQGAVSRPGRGPHSAGGTGRRARPTGCRRRWRGARRPCRRQTTRARATSAARSRRSVVPARTVGPEPGPVGDLPRERPLGALPVTSTVRPRARSPRRPRPSARRASGARRWPRRGGSASPPAPPRPDRAAAEAARGRRDRRGCRTRSSRRHQRATSCSPARHAGTAALAAPRGERRPGPRRRASSARWLCGPAAVEVDGDVGAVRARRRAAPSGARRRSSSTAPVERGERRERARARRAPAVVGEAPRERAQGGHRGEQVAQAERAQDERGAGALRPGGLDRRARPRARAARTRAAGRARRPPLRPRRPGRLSIASGAGWYWSVAAVEERRVHAAGHEQVTPTRPASSAASARVKPTTPNLLAQ